MPRRSKVPHPQDGFDNAQSSSSTKHPRTSGSTSHREESGKGSGCDRRVSGEGRAAGEDDEEREDEETEAVKAKKIVGVAALACLKCRQRKVSLLAHECQALRLSALDSRSRFLLRSPNATGTSPLAATYVSLPSLYFFPSFSSDVSPSSLFLFQCARKGLECSWAKSRRGGARVKGSAKAKANTPAPTPSTSTQRRDDAGSSCSPPGSCKSSFSFRLMLSFCAGRD